jgi:hypothetical protein
MENTCQENKSKSFEELWLLASQGDLEAQAELTRRQEEYNQANERP